jgi:hypothetical protein
MDGIDSSLLARPLIFDLATRIASCSLRLVMARVKHVGFGGFR